MIKNGVHRKNVVTFDTLPPDFSETVQTDYDDEKVIWDVCYVFKDSKTILNCSLNVYDARFEEWSKERTLTFGPNRLGTSFFEFETKKPEGRRYYFSVDSGEHFEPGFQLDVSFLRVLNPRKEIQLTSIGGLDSSEMGSLFRTVFTLVEEAGSLYRYYGEGYNFIARIRRFIDAITEYVGGTALP